MIALLCLFLTLSFPTIPCSGIRAVRQNQRVIRYNAYAILRLLTTLVADLFKSRRRLEVENLFLRHQPQRRPEASTTTSPAAGE